jgi:4a-hydroxytetrahydrobiopterin dehydratase
MIYNLRFTALRWKPLLQLSLSICLASGVIAFTLPNHQLRADTMTLNETQINQKIQSLPGWTVKDKTIFRTFKFKNFVEAIDFVNKLVKPAESAGHHPDLAISYNQVVVSLTSHDAGGITQKDFDLAEIISKIAE